jgi:hypothetical protein
MTNIIFARVRPVLAAFAGLLTTVVVPWHVASAQTTSDQLYYAVQQAQQALGTGAPADEIRDRFLVRQLETESARGFTARVDVLEEAAGRFASAEIPGELAAVDAALQAHLKSLREGESLDVAGEVLNLSTTLQLVDLGVLDASRQKTLAVLRAMNDSNREDLSSYGRFHLNRKLGFESLYQALERFEFRVGDIDPESYLQLGDESDDEFQQRISRLESEQQDLFNRNLNTLRNQIARARQLFGLAWLQYENQKIAIAERSLFQFEKQLAAYLLVQSRRRGAFEEQLQVRKQAFVSQQGQPVPPEDRLYQAELGRWLGLLSTRQQDNGLAVAARRQFSKPNLRITLQESLANRLGGQTVSQVDHVDEVIVGSRAQGFSYTSGAVNVDFLENPHSARVRIQLGGSIQSSTYSKEGPVTAYTSSGGNFQASRDVLANVGNLSIYDPDGWAGIATSFLGTNCGGPITRIASRRFGERQRRAEEIASERARDRMLGQFSAETDAALADGRKQFAETRSRRDEALAWFKELRGRISMLYSANEQGQPRDTYDLIDPLGIPRIFVKSSNSELQIGGVLEGSNRLAASTEPGGPTVPADVRVQIHESLLSNFMAPFLQNQLLENWKIRNTIEALVGGDAELPARADDRPFAIRFEDGRPIQIEFDNNEVGVTVFGKEFRQGGNSYADPLNINVRFRILDDQGELKLVRVSRAVAEFTYDPLEGKSLDVGFKSFLQDNLDKSLAGDPLDNAIALPTNLIPLENVKDEEARNRLANARLVEVSMENGWLTLGWNYVTTDRPVQASYTPAIWSELPEMEQPPTDDRQPDLDLNDAAAGNPAG